MVAARQLIAGLMILTVSHISVAADDEDIQGVFEAYRVAVLAADGDAAYDLVDKTTRDYYSRILDDVRYASAEEVGKRSKLDKLFIVRSRHQIPQDKLKTWDGESYFQYAIDSGWIDKGSVSTTEITEIQVSGDVASSKLKQKEEIAPFGFEFNKEADGWKLNLISMFSLGEMTLQNVVRQSDKDENEVIVSIVESLSGEEVSDTIWAPPFERP
jgi:hypothetical protein